ncbi:MAG: Gfo/Idh/MocA family oxidoreductase [bacterium]|nr:Gfo/Idh/MocA family oxidoreductase [bacterium]
MVNHKFVVGQIGCGAFAREQHGPNCLRNPHIAKIKWACDISHKNAIAYAERFNVEKVTDSFQEVTTDPEVDIICIATPHDGRVEIIQSATNHGKHIFCEKPMALHEKECYEIIKAVRKGGKKFCVDYMRRKAPAVLALKREWLNHIKKPKHQPWRYIESKRDKLLEETVSDFLVRVQDESSTYRMIHLDPYSGGGLIIGEAGHWLDLACWLFDQDRPIEIRAWGSARMRYGIYLTFQSGNSATIIYTPNGTFDYPKEMFEIAADGALFRMEFYVENQYFGRPGEQRELFPLERDPFPNIGTQGGFQGYLEKYRYRVQTSQNAKQDWGSLMVDHGYQGMFDGFIDSIIHNTPEPCDVVAGYRATLLCNLAIQSIHLNQPLPIPAEKWDMYVHLE